MICVTPRATAGSGKPAPPKSGSAMEMGLTLPRVTSSVVGAPQRAARFPQVTPPHQRYIAARGGGSNAAH